MISILSLITFLLRLTLVIQSQLVEIVPADFFGSNSCSTSEQKEQEIKSSIFGLGFDDKGLIETQEEEKEESEQESYLNFLESYTFLSSWNLSFGDNESPFGSKGAKVGVHLYDLFHSWKVYAS
ncbi:hypothetical protein DFQ04_0393 [Algoriphagus boseongensis]|uniref:Uncharacterized protein n=1 Tax=Algoriphagus boseongensis TaxID=1442587 RepID=A0A4R6T6J3_9BACT|nr:hypothetical protein [Algoriphagus boseongensis]TDQ18590.1 hypothetical protein DFQ04_0393 [Algoriphagus boseongensis]